METKLLREHMRRVYRLCCKHNVPYKDVRKGKIIGALSGYWGLDVIEYLFHEVGHAMTLGQPFTRLPQDLPKWIDQKLDRMSPPTRNALEVDTSVVTFYAGYQLGLWEDVDPFQESCRRNLCTITDFMEFRVLWARHWGQEHLVQQGQALASWFQGQG